MKPLKASLIIIIAVFSFKLMGQENLWYEKNFDAYAVYMADNFGIQYHIPEKFNDLDKYYVMWKVRKDPAKHAGFMYGSILMSKNKDCIVAYPSQLFNYSDKEKKRLGISKSNFPRNQVSGYLKTALGLYYSYGNPLNNDTAKFDFNDYVTTIAGKKARELFNADSIYIYDLPNPDSVCFYDASLERLRKERYPHCTGILISKANRASIDLKLFFTDKGKENMDEHLNMLEKQIWYDNNFAIK